MRHAKTLALALLAALSLGALASATASAVEPAQILPTGEEVKFKGTSGGGTLTTLGGVTIACEKATGEGTVAAGAKLGPFHQMLEKCSSSGIACTGLGEASGVVLVLGETHLVVDKATPELGAGILLLANALHVTCSIVLVEIKGEELCLVKPINTKTSHFETACEGSAGDPKETKYWNEKGEEVNISLGLLVSINHAAFEGAARTATASGEPSKEIEIMA